ncbi:hypothetical protein FIBSPDRAFT_789285 [Athelia psychrophila]|uniref:Macrofage activating glyco protein n=1 Tax=Athelia psychrophila TaxID=1759441 RepID=A0A166JA86_9AGAM|nr:hypothetical protein FIBSPDRAFT_789285 [Fibularhizoctonia sp. CBS 109695]
MVDTDQGTRRGPQQGYNICNSTTEGTSSMCQTSMVNSIDDFCLWAPSKANSTIADTEGEEVAWCTKPGRGTRVIPPTALTGVQFMRTPDYIQIVGFLDQSMINMEKDDYGGELDPHGADLRGNPMGGLMYSNAFASSNGNNESYHQVIEWTNFMGGGAFCLKICDPAGPNAAQFCQHVYDRIGCAYNAPNAAPKGVFETCDGDNADFPGVYTDPSGAVQTYTQPPESLGAISTMPYQPKVPSSSNCVTHSAAELYASAAAAYPSSSASAPSATGAAAGSSGKVNAPTGSRTGGAANAVETGGATNGGSAVHGSIFGISLVGAFVATALLL